MIGEAETLGGTIGKEDEAKRWCGMCDRVCFVIGVIGGGGGLCGEGEYT